MPQAQQTEQTTPPRKRTMEELAQVIVDNWPTAYAPNIGYVNTTGKKPQDWNVADLVVIRREDIEAIRTHIAANTKAIWQIMPNSFREGHTEGEARLAFASAILNLSAKYNQVEGLAAENIKGYYANQWRLNYNDVKSHEMTFTRPEFTFSPEKATQPRRMVTVTARPEVVAIYDIAQDVAVNNRPESQIKPDVATALAQANAAITGKLPTITLGDQAAFDYGFTLATSHAFDDLEVPVNVDLTRDQLRDLAKRAAVAYDPNAPLDISGSDAVTSGFTVGIIAKRNNYALTETDPFKIPPSMTPLKPRAEAGAVAPGSPR